MQLVKQEYYHSLAMLKEIIQEKNCADVTDDLDNLDEIKTEDEKNIETESQIVSVVEDVAIVSSEQEEEDEVVFEESHDDENKFEFISPEDEKQLKSLRKQTQQAIPTKKKTKRSSSSQQKRKSLGSRQISQLQKDIVIEQTHDFTFHWPLELHHFWLSSLFGARKKANGKPGFHYGIDMAAMRGTPVKAAAGGTVVQAQYVPGYGNNILIQHNKYYRTRYAHLQRIHVTEGQKVTQGQKIGTVGDTGSVRKSGRDASHLHFEIYHNGIHVNPLRYLFN